MTYRIFPTIGMRVKALVYVDTHLFTCLLCCVRGKGLRALLPLRTYPLPFTLSALLPFAVFLSYREL